METAELFRLGRGAVSVFSAPSPGRSKGNEDAAALIPAGRDAAVLAVADGVGGLPSGGKAAATVITALLRHVGRRIGRGPELREAILAAIESANRTILDWDTGSATTLALAELRANSLRTYHVGDSMVLVANRRGRVKAETVPHSPVGYALESGFLTESAAAKRTDRHLVSNVIGSADLHVSVSAKVPFSPEDTLLIATDGLSDNVRKGRILQLMRNGSLAGCSKALVDLARRRMSNGSGPGRPDDLTVILYRRAGVA